GRRRASRNETGGGEEITTLPRIVLPALLGVAPYAARRRAASGARPPRASAHRCGAGGPALARLPCVGQAHIPARDAQPVSDPTQHIVSPHLTAMYDRRYFRLRLAGQRRDPLLAEP